MDTDNERPVDPVSENMNMIKGKPVKAFLTQDHEAHLAVHTSAMQDPKIMQMVGQSPNAAAIQAAAAAHIAEHVAFQYRKQIEEAAGVPYPAPEAEMNPETELQISRLAAAAAQKVLQDNQAKAAQQQAQQTAQDPIVQMQQAELQIKQQELQLKQQQFAVDSAVQNDKLDLEKERLAVQERIAGLQVGAKVATDKANLSAKQQLEGLRIGVEVAREASQQAKPQAPENRTDQKET
jgi:hypothetical protein